MALLAILLAGSTATPAAAFLDFIDAEGTDPTFGLARAAATLDGRHIYVTAAPGDAILTFERDTQTGAVTLVDAIYDTSPGVDGLHGAQSVAVSGDSRHVYVAGYGEYAVSAFSRDPATGLLTWIGVWKEGVDGVVLLSGARGVYVSPAGSQVYVASESASAVTVFDRDPVTGLLDQNQILAAEYPYVLANDVTSTPNGFNVYTAGDQIAAHSRDSVTGTLTRIDVEFSVEGDDLGSRAIAVSPDARHLYVTDWTHDRTVCFAIDSVTGALTYASQVFGPPAGGGNWQEHGIAVSPEGARVYVSRFSAGDLLVYLRDLESGALTLEETRHGGDEGIAGFGAPTDVIATPDGRSVYILSQPNSSVLAFSTPNRVEFLQRTWDGDPEVQGLNGVGAIAAAPDGAQVYAASPQGAVVHFDRAEDGALGFVGASSDTGLDGASAIAVTPDGHFVLVAATADDSLSLFERNVFDGSLALADQALDGSLDVDGLDAPVALALSPDGAHAYVASAGDDEVAAFEVAGALGFLEVEPITGSGSRDAQPTGVAVAPDGAHVYVTSEEGSVTIFERDANGFLTQADVVAGDGMAGARAVAVSPDGLHVYVASDEDDAIVAFERDGSALSFVEVERAGVSGFAPPGGAKSLVFSPDGTELYAADAQDDSIVRFARDAATGELRFLELERDFTNLLGYDGPRALASSADGRNLYVAMAASDSVLSFSTVPEPSASGAVAAAALLALRRRFSARRA